MGIRTLKDTQLVLGNEENKELRGHYKLGIFDIYLRKKPSKGI